MLQLIVRLLRSYTLKWFGQSSSFLSGSGNLLGVIVILTAMLAWWRPWEVSALHGRYAVLKAALLIVEVRIKLRRYRFRFQLLVKLLILGVKIRYLLIKRMLLIVVHKFQRRAKTPNKDSTAHLAANLVSRFEIYFAIKLQSSAFAPRFQNPFEAAKRRPKIARSFNCGSKPKPSSAVVEPAAR
jgi:hypothetical protein